MQYHDGQLVLLGDTVLLPIPDGKAQARIVMLGDTGEHSEIDPKFLSWIGSANLLRPTAVVVEWIDRNPFAHQDPTLAAVGNYMFTDVDEWVSLQRRAEA